jgi:FKBP-type peptidyl-prolyl cis-trans isomerase 2
MPMTEARNSTPIEFEITTIDLPENVAVGMREIIRALIEIASDTMDVSGLDGVTIAVDYNQALLNLDRGYKTNFKLEPSQNYGVGIAMSPRVIRNGQLMTHVVFNAGALLGLLEQGQKDVFINTVIHECAHVELNHLYEKAFPGKMLRTKENALDSFRTDCMLGCWDEFAACWKSATFGPCAELFYESAFLPALAETRQSANEAIKEYRTHSDAVVVINQVCHLYGRLLKYSAYHLGNLYGHGIDWRTVPSTADALQDHWFLPFFERLDAACKAIADDFGNWQSSAPFDVLRDLAEELVADGGMYFTRHSEDHISMDVPFSEETMPVPRHLWF